MITMATVLPKTLKIGGMIFSIVYDDNLPNDEDKFGTINFRSLTITIAGTLPPSVMKDALWHEIIEAINEQNELNLNHQKIQCISNALYQVVVDNRDLV